MACWPLVMGGKPAPDAPRAALKEFALRSATYFCILILVFFAAIVCAWLSLRQTRDEFREQARENLQSLIEGTLQDHGKKTD